MRARGKAPRDGVPERDPSEGARARTAALAALAAVSILSGFLHHRQIDGPDVGFHLSLGRFLVESGGVPRADPLTFTRNESPYVDTQWLYQVALWSLHSVSGTLGVVLANTGALLAALGLLVVRSLGRESLWTAAAPVPLLLFVLGVHPEIRPHVASWVFLGAVLLALESWRRGRARAVWWIVPLMLVWSNVHSLFVLGLVAAGAYALFEILRGRRADRQMLLAAGASVVVCLVNPYGASTLLFPLTQMRMLEAGSVFKSAAGILEFASPFDLTAYTANRAFVVIQPLLFLQIYGVLALATLPFAWRRASAPERLLFALFAYVFWRGQKNFGYFAVASFPLVVSGLREALRTARLRRALRILATPWPSVAVILACIGIGMQIRSGWWLSHERLPYRFGHSFNGSFLPVGAAGFLTRPDVPPGRMLNTFDEGGFLGFATSRPVFIDSRAELVGPEFFEYYTGLERPENLARAIERHSIEIAVVPYGQMTPWFQFFETSPRWRRVFADDLDAVYFSRGFAPGIPAMPPPEPGADYTERPAVEEREILERALERDDPGPLATMLGSHYYPTAELRRSGFFLLTREPRAALAVGLEGLLRSTFDARDLLVNVGHAYWDLGRRAHAARCYEAVIERGGIPGTSPQLEHVLRERVRATRGSG